MRAPEFWRHKGIAAALLLPASGIYYAAARLRRAVTRPVTLPVPVICIGNLVAGGAGKTPLALAVGEMLRAKGKNAFFLSRGYGGSLRGPVLVSETHTAAEVGDEPLLLAKLLPTLIAKNRVQGALAAVQRGAEVIIMDDGFQNPAIGKTFSLLVVDGISRFGNECLLPAGPLREPMAEGIARADALMVIGGDYSAPGKPVFSARLAPDAAAEVLRGRRVVAFAGIGRPEKFRATLEEVGCKVMAFESFADHHAYRLRELERLAVLAREEDAELVTTEKDAARLSPAWRQKVTVLRVVLHIENGEALWRMLQEAVES